ncbi:DUF5384 family protein, partial [Escherichia coli]|uniref:DUF5384 family protein n=1 Tax=Escherichia coli TaxID=562 RepID=UPI00208DD334
HSTCQLNNTSPSMTALACTLTKKEEARVKRENEFIDQELKHKAAQTDVVQSEADANRNMTEGGRDLMKSVGKAEENKSDSWFN